MCIREWRTTAFSCGVTVSGMVNRDLRPHLARARPTRVKLVRIARVGVGRRLSAAPPEPALGLLGIAQVTARLDAGPRAPPAARSSAAAPSHRRRRSHDAGRSAAGRSAPPTRRSESLAVPGNIAGSSAARSMNRGQACTPSRSAYLAPEDRLVELGAERDDARIADEFETATSASTGSVPPSCCLPADLVDQDVVDLARAVLAQHAPRRRRRGARCRP